MKLYSKITKMFGLAFALLTLAVKMQAGNYAWYPPVPITDPTTTLNLPGTIVGAKNFGASGDTTVYTVTLTNGINVVFSSAADATVATSTSNGSQGPTPALIVNLNGTGTSGDANFDAVLSSFQWDGGPHIISLNNLVVGKLYSVQLFGLDDRSGTPWTRTQGYADRVDVTDYSQVTSMGDNDYVVGAFVATNSTMLIRQGLLNGNNGNINALVVRTLPAAVIGTQPQSKIQYTNTAATFTVGAAGNGISYQWQAGVAGSGTFTNLISSSQTLASDVTNATLTISNAVFGNAGDYRVLVYTNSTISLTSSVANLNIISPATAYESQLLLYSPIAYWRLTETNSPTPRGAAQAYDFISGFNGFYGTNVVNNVPGPRTTDGFATFGTTNLAASFTRLGSTTPNPVDSIVALPPLNLSPQSNFTMTAWIYPVGSQGTFWGIVFNRNGGAAAGLNTGPAAGPTGMPPIGYTWTTTSGNSFNFNSGLYPPANQWSFVALTITPTNAVISLANAGGFQSATNVAAHSGEPFQGQSFQIGGDENSGPQRVFNGSIDEVALFPSALTSDQLQTMFSVGISPNPVPPSVGTQPVNTSAYQGEVASLSVSALGSPHLFYQWQASSSPVGVFTNLVEGDGHVVGSLSSALAITNITPAYQLYYRVIVSNFVQNVANWTTSSVASVTVFTTTPVVFWTGPVKITTADATLSLPNSTVVGAIVGGGIERVVHLTNGSAIDFKVNDGTAFATVTGNGTDVGAFSGNTSNADFNAVLNNFKWDGGPKTITLTGLIPGQQYQMQLFSLDDRAGDTGRPANYQVQSDPNDPYDTSPTFNMGDNIYMLGTFTADGTGGLTFIENLLTGGLGNFNALVLRVAGNVTIGPAIALQPTSISRYVGRPAQLSVGASGNPLNYQWQAGKTNSGSFTNLIDSANISGSTNYLLKFAAATTNNTADYRVIVSNSSGSVTSSVATLTVVVPQPSTYETAVLALNPLSFWRLNETNDTSTGTAVANDLVGGFDGIYGTTVDLGVTYNGGVPYPGPGVTDGFLNFGTNDNAALFFNGNPASAVTLASSFAVSTNRVTMTAWINPGANLGAFWGILMSRNGGDDCGMTMGPNTGTNGMAPLGYIWAGNSSTWGYDSKIYPPATQWSFVAVVVSPANAILYIMNTNGISIATNTFAHVVGWNVGGRSQIGNDITQTGRQFNGLLADVAIFKSSLTQAQLQSLYNQANVPIINLTIVPVGGGQYQLQWAQGGTLLESPSLTGPWTTNINTAPYTFTPTGAQKFYRVLVR